jgi:hypothetical protein
MAVQDPGRGGYRVKMPEWDLVSYNLAILPFVRFTGLGR